MTKFLKVTVPPAADILGAFTTHYDALAEAGTETMREAAEIAKARGRLAIRAGGAGFQAKWPNALRSQVYPKSEPSAKAAALIYIRSTYAGIFEEGGTVRPSRRSLLWIPLENTPKKVFGKKVTPAILAQSLGRPLTYIARPGKPPLLVTFVRVGASKLDGPVTRAALNKGLDAKGKRKVARMVPLFVGVRRVTIPKKWAIRAAVEQASRQVPGIYTEVLGRITRRRVVNGR